MRDVIVVVIVIVIILAVVSVDTISLAPVYWNQSNPM